MSKIVREAIYTVFETLGPVYPWINKIQFPIRPFFKVKRNSILNKKESLF